MSLAQERLWHLEQIGMVNGAYNMSHGFRLAGRLDVGAFNAALTALVERHESLRTRFPVVNDVGTQLIDPPCPVAVSPIDVTEEELLPAIARISTRPFDLARDTLYRFTLFRLGNEHHVLSNVLHHIVSDGWSSGVLMRDLITFYNAFRAGRPSPLQPLPIQYADYAIWQRRFVEAGGLDRELAFWRKTLGDAAPGLDLPTDRPRPRVSSSRGARIAVSVPRPLTGALTELAKKREG